MAEQQHFDAPAPEPGKRSTSSRREQKILREVQQEERQLENQIGEREARRMQYIAQPPRSVWFGLGMFGLVGWSVTVPALIGIAIGIWIDTQWPGPWSWTLMLLMAGVTIGCLNALAWVSREARIDDSERSPAAHEPGNSDPPKRSADRSDRV